MSAVESGPPETASTSAGKDCSPEKSDFASDAKTAFRTVLSDYVNDDSVDEAVEESFPASDSPASNARANSRPHRRVKVTLDGQTFDVDHGAVVIASITSCTNTSNPQVMIGAALLARKAVEIGLRGS